MLLGPTSNSHSRAGIRSLLSLVKGIVVDGCTGCMAAACSAAALARARIRLLQNQPLIISEERRFDPRRTPAADRRTSELKRRWALPGNRASGRAVADRPASGSRRRPTDGPTAAASPAGQRRPAGHRRSRAVVRRQRFDSEPAATAARIAVAVMFSELNVHLDRCGHRHPRTHRR